MAKVHIRRLADSDFQALVELLLELSHFAHAAGSLEPESVRATFKYMQTHGGYNNFVALIENQVVGLLSMVSYKSFYHRGGTALINELVISTPFRGKGVGRDLVLHAKEVAQADGMDEIEVGTEKINTRAIGFYRKVGFNEEYILLGNEFNAGQSSK